MFVDVCVKTDVLMPHPRRRRWLSLRAQLRAGKLDSQLAAGTAPESSDLLFAHTDRIVRPRSCAALASSLRKVVVTAQRPVRLSNRAPLTRADIHFARGELLALAERLQRPGPVQARGVAQVRMLLGDGSGPLYCRESGNRLLSDIRAASTHLSLCRGYDK